MIRLIVLIMLLSTPAVAQIALPSTGGGDPRLQAIQYDAGRVVRLRVAMGFQTTVILDPNEQIENVALGDSAAWQVTPNRRGDHLFIKPLQSGGTTNLTVITDARVYTFELSATYGPTADTPFTVRFLYPDAGPSIARDISPPQSEAGRYRLSGSRALRPRAVSDDGMRTYIEWGPEQALPAVFALDDRRKEILLDGHMRDGRYVIDAVHQTLLFRLDHQVARATRLRPGAGR